MSVEFDRESARKFDSRTLNRKTLNRWTGRRHMIVQQLEGFLTNKAPTATVKRSHRHSHAHLDLGDTICLTLLV